MANVKGSTAKAKVAVKAVTEAAVKAEPKKVVAKAVNGVLQAKRFVIRKSLIGTGVVVEFTNAKGVQYKYDHDEVFNANKERFESMPCFNQYGNYTNSNAIPAFARSLDSVEITQPEASK